MKRSNKTACKNGREIKDKFDANLSNNTTFHKKQDEIEQQKYRYLVEYSQSLVKCLEIMKRFSTH